MTIISPATGLPEVLLEVALKSFPEPWMLLLMLVLCIIWRCIPYVFQLLQQTIPHRQAHRQKREIYMQIAQLTPKQARQANEALRALNGQPEKEDRE